MQPSPGYGSHRPGAGYAGRHPTASARTRTHPVSARNTAGADQPGRPQRPAAHLGHHREEQDGREAELAGSGRSLRSVPARTGAGNRAGTTVRTARAWGSPHT
ncbi:hypothetical protein [Streptomyces sp. NPDC052721]|uniref:hypothetical protein n=1 Tax=Streptomyces sp. NPDC052721 TaxID=3154955 RepID=UPI0034302782